jgi:glycosyltransferase involved in cell wall biosynthesis
MYGDPSQAVKSCRDILDCARQDNQIPFSGDYEIFDDRREKSTYRASVIVSLYNAASKLSFFLNALQNQTLLQRKEAEIILVDSGSPSNEYEVFQELATQFDFSMLFVRSQQRETIQSAWNRGISLSHAPYLAFLGVDETIVPDCLEVLAAELDADGSLDWVIGNSLVTNVDIQGSWVNDIMTYDRRGYQQDLIYLETCYLSWVGALYRRDIHDRFGYYDSSFRAAGDTEFKGRVLPFIKTKAIDRNLGLFWNYPDERTTQSPLAELEDLRAWYLHRTLGGIQYAFAPRRPEEAENLLYAALAYRKSYCQHTSTDIEYAYNLSLFLQENLPNSKALFYFEGIQHLLQTYRNLDWISPLSVVAPGHTLWQVWNSSQVIAERHQQQWNQDNISALPLAYQVFNDNRQEQHSNLWFTPTT